ncbi:MAG: hypothetical protein ACI39H_03545 [Lachnospiraceae bacterium]
MKKRLMEKLKQSLALSVILGCLVCAFYLNMDSVPDYPDEEISCEAKGYLFAPEKTLKMNDARELSSDLARTTYIRQDSFKKQVAGSNRLYPAACLCAPELLQAVLTYESYSVKTAVRSQHFLIHYIHDQDGEK